jgi:hypothetical protein
MEKLSQTKPETAVAAATTSIQCALSIGAVNDPLEAEADAVADQVMRMPMPGTPVLSGTIPSIQRQCAACAQEEELQRKPIAETIRRKGDGGGQTASPAITSSIHATRGSGSRMDGATQSFMESRFGTDFSSVNIHTGDYAVQMSRDLSAKAFTVGNDIYFNSGQYNPGSDSGKHLLAHELTHTVQQGGRLPSIQKLDLTRHSFSKGLCGERNIQWVFALSSPAPEDGYIVQHIKSLETTAACPSDIRHTELAPKLEFWEAWKIKKGDKVDWTTTRDAWTDGSTRGPQSNSSGTQTSLGKVKFFLQSVTGDLGDFGVAPTGASDWGPGKEPTSGDLPSTKSKPSWWDGTPTEGPKSRWASSWWNCCGEISGHFSIVDSNP